MSRDLAGDHQKVILLDSIRTKLKKYCDRAVAHLFRSRTMARDSDERWSPDGDEVESAILCQIVSDVRRQYLANCLTCAELTADCVSELDKLRTSTICSLSAAVKEHIYVASSGGPTQLKTRVPVLLACEALIALLCRPWDLVTDGDDSAQRQIEGAVWCFASIVRALHNVRAPNWTLGAARATHNGQPGAFMTFQCTRALHFTWGRVEATARCVIECTTLSATL